MGAAKCVEGRFEEQERTLGPEHPCELAHGSGVVVDGVDDGDRDDDVERRVGERE
jgi:hypothetical protein